MTKNGADVHDVYKDRGYETKTAEGVPVTHEDEFNATTTIDKISDFTLATYLMENKISM